MSLFGRLSGNRDDCDSQGCRCEATFREPSGTGLRGRSELHLDATECTGDGDLQRSPACRARVVRALARRDADVVVTHARGRTRRYRPGANALLLAAGRFHERVSHHDDRLAGLAATDPLDAVREATGRAGPASRIAAESGLAEIAAGINGYEEALPSANGLSIARARIADRVPTGATLRDRFELETGAVVRTYDRPDTPPLYRLTPPSLRLDPAHAETLVAARDRFRQSAGKNGSPSADGAVAAEIDAAEHRTDGDGVSTVPAERLAAILRKHTRGNGVFEDLFADPDVTDAFVSAPVEENPVRLLRDGQRFLTNVWFPPTAAATFASRLRRESGRGFSRADPTLDASTEIGGDPVRVAATTAPVTDGLAFALRRRDRTPWTLPRLIHAGTLPPRAAGLLSVAVQRGAALLVAGGRGCGKTTLLGALLWELSPGVRTLVVEDTPELPVDRLQSAGRDVQRLHADQGGTANERGTSRESGGGVSPTEAVRTALRLGDGALVVGEVRGTEAAALYEAMRVGAQREAVLGTIHGDGADGVRERVVADLGVPASAFAATDAVVTLDGRYRLSALEEIRGDGDDVRSVSLFEGSDAGSTTGVCDRGNSHLLSSLARSEETYTDVWNAVERRSDRLERLAETDRHRPSDLDSGRFAP
ncbi:type II secretion system protein E [Halalkaliarchaeum desulfuricum]|uniref:Type II secretion system protein E n=1 Tax=Halalkaliarchaeum desulfuricum TaxID=2055893 RepID=A0A343TJ89_9EURY|nr:ATPase, T2SS/T4P/T4SS family [Halalkaliarchaeum desulfuricum]AUX09161.1 type II secretion system protein E [Halalkaliarchaeum desulfuricum]